jgi:hypothetical protein
MKTTWLSMATTLLFLGCGDEVATGGSGPGGNDQGGNTSTTTDSGGGEGGANQGGANQGGAGGSSCNNVPPPRGELSCGGTAVTSTTGGTTTCAESCTDDGGNAYEVECTDTTCLCKYYGAFGTGGSGGGSNGVTVGVTTGTTTGPSASSTGGGEENVICECQLAVEACGPNFQHCCPAPWN